jgi:hypothetical protein
MIAGPGEGDRGWAIFEIEARLHGAECDFAMAIGTYGNAGRLDEVEVIAIPQIGLDNPPFADERVIADGHHVGACASSFGKRTRL